MKYLLALCLVAVAFSLVPRTQAPSFQAIAVLPNHSFKKISLSDYSGKYVVLLFYPFDFTYVCPTEITSYSDKAEEFKSKIVLIEKLELKFWPFQLTHISLIWLGEKQLDNKEDWDTQIFLQLLISPKKSPELTAYQQKTLKILLTEQLCEASSLLMEKEK